MQPRLNATGLPDWLSSILAASPSAYAATSLLLFHGTLEPFDGRLRASSWEGLRWATQDPCVAQSYCPETGSVTGWSAPEPYRLAENMLPEGPINKIIFRELGFDEFDLDATRDHNGRFQSWRVLPNHPKWQDALTYMLGLGYDPSSGYCWVKTHCAGNKDVILPANHKDCGRMFIIERPADLRIYDHSIMVDGGLTGQQWMQTDVFRATAASSRWDGIKIDDVHQSKKMGHFGHASIGLFEPTLARLRYHVIDIVHYDPWDSWQHRTPSTTPEFEALWSYCKNAHCRGARQAGTAQLAKAA
jgi:hypothetical protein